MPHSAIRPVASPGRARRLFALGILLLALCLPGHASGEAANATAGLPRHELKLDLDLASGSLHARDILTLPAPAREAELLLAPGASLESAEAGGRPARVAFEGGRLLVRADAPFTRLTLVYRAAFGDKPPDDPVAFDNPGFGVEATIGPKGAVLLPGSRWYPQLTRPAPQGSMAAYKVEVRAPLGFAAVTTGRLLGHRDDPDANATYSGWEVERAPEPLALVAGRFAVGRGRLEEKPDSPEILAYFTSGNEALIPRYLEAAARHIRFYSDLFGPYPFASFAVVENFYPTGYGFPGFTLLGGTVLRLPFIPETSLRHEAAHCWWGNGVLVDYARGNWSEGLASYVADYLARERESPEAARDYRLESLRRFADLGASSPLTLERFIARDDPASSAVGYGKAMFVFHMVRRTIGDDAFWSALREVSREFLFRRASWEDFRRAFVKAGNWDEATSRRFFEQWLTRPGGPRLALADIRAVSSFDSWRVLGALTQTATDNGAPYALDVPLALERAGGGTASAVLRLAGPRAAVELEGRERPARLVADPGADVFRVLAPEEVPATVNALKGARRLTAVLAASEPEERLPAYADLLEGLGWADAKVIPEAAAGPEALAELRRSAVLLLGVPRRPDILAALPKAPPALALAPGNVTLSFEAPADVRAAVWSDPAAPGRVAGLAWADPDASAQSVRTALRKVTHYGSSSYLGFSQGNNTLKGVWPVTASPLIHDFGGAASKEEQP